MTGMQANTPPAPPSPAALVAAAVQRVPPSSAAGEQAAVSKAAKRVTSLLREIKSLVLTSGMQAAAKYDENRYRGDHWLRMARRTLGCDEHACMQRVGTLAARLDAAVLALGEAMERAGVSMSQADQLALMASARSQAKVDFDQAVNATAPPLPPTPPPRAAPVIARAPAPPQPPKPPGIHDLWSIGAHPDTADQSPKGPTA